MIEYTAPTMTIQNKRPIFLFGIAFMLGGALRFLPGVLSGFPVNDGGMLFAMIRDLRSNGFVLPVTASYNQSGIPFAYPPFGLYVAAVLSWLLSISELEILHWFPPLISAAIVPVVYWLACKILRSQSKASIAVLLYAFMPGSSDWLIMGGGLTRSLGIFFSLLAIGCGYELFNRASNRVTIGLAISFCTLAVLSHPEVGLQTAALYLVFWLCYGRDVRGIKNASLVALGTALLSSPWWWTVVHYHGLAPFQSAVQTGIHETLFASLFHGFFSLQGGLPLLPFFSLIGIFVVVHKGDILLVLWTLIPFFVDPRNASAVAIFPLLLLAAEGIYHLNVQFIRAYSKTFPKGKSLEHRFSFLLHGSFGIVVLYLLWNALIATPNLVRISLTPADRQTMQWASENTSAESRFLLLTNDGTISPMTDAYQEWFPALSERRSLNTLQGMEWILGPDFFQYSRELVALQSCRDEDCLSGWLGKNNVQTDFILLRKKKASQALIESLRTDRHYEMVYESSETIIYAFHP